VKWPTFIGKSRNQPTGGRWHEWKELIANDCEGRCIYCAIQEARFGGIRNFHIEHFRPKVKFETLEDDITNLYLACAICNVLKSDDWPSEPADDHSLPAYPDPARIDYNLLFGLSSSTHEVSSASVAGRYVIERLCLNRAQLVLERRLASILSDLAGFDAWVEESLGVLTEGEQKETISIMLGINRARDTALNARPYRDADTKRRGAVAPATRRSRSGKVG
jgi:hypothetical protein